MKTNILYPAALVAIVLAVAAAVAVNVDYRGADADLAAPGAQLYQTAVIESVKTLNAEKAQAGAGRPASPGPDYFWCENCKTYHRRQAAPNQAGATPAAAPQVHPPATPAAGNVAGQALGTEKGQAKAIADRPPSPGPDFFWCENCKTYHRRQAAPNQAAPAIGNFKPGATPADQAHVHDAAVPEGDGDYYYCDNCKVYHRRPATLPQPAR